MKGLIHPQRLFLLRLVCLAAIVFMAACAEAATGGSARFSVSSRVRFNVDTASVILYTECGSNFSRLAGVANGDDEAVILQRDQCGEEWWYQVQVGALKDEDWKGIGWVPEGKLKSK